MDLIKSQLERRLGHQFEDKSLMELALTHRSCGNTNNERLEFLGDSLLGVFIAEALFLRFPEAKEGQLSRLRSSLVKGETLAKIAREFDIGDCLNLGSGELKSGGFRRESILADSVEALIGAIYLDSDMATCKEHVLRWYAERLQQTSLERSGKDAKTLLQELLQSRKHALPVYQMKDVTGEAHEQTFSICCQHKLLKQPTIGVGSSRRQAEQQAAQLALEILGELK
ncbi:Ribonuclease 3 [Sinobacterium norvegicum]|uniref:Ribonuclease 3 n=1 Tax=Sinobacterium norvegicum TaxID=1641715 RepID=A0ABN8EH72_9GAMM|nr:ribonuclease III [Sinobacterium norvegicum]CAH0990414.1 Ribonuclease 3 [Sinobacterium norvegicum]